MATMQEVDAAMRAIERALRPSLIERLRLRARTLLGAPPPSAMITEFRRDIAALAQGLRVEGDIAGGDARGALESLAHRAGLYVSDDPDGDDWDDGESYLSFDEPELDEARRRAERGQIDDCLHHLERALPEGYGVIAERLAHHFRSRT